MRTIDRNKSSIRLQENGESFAIGGGQPKPGNQFEMPAGDRIKGGEKNLSCRFMKYTDPAVQRVAQQRIFDLLHFLRIASEWNHCFFQSTHQF